MNGTGNVKDIGAKSVPVRHEVRKPLKAHDVRHLAVCAICGGIADDRDAISYERAYGYKAQDSDACWHPRCCFEHFGAEFVRRLPHSEQEKFRLCDIPASLMKELVDDA